MKSIRSIPPQTWALTAILLLAAALRLYRWYDMPFTNDELSALYRLRFDSFSALLSEGIKPDGHPPLVQVFLYYYVKLFGTEAVTLKLPFILAGTAAVYFCYRCGRSLSGPVAGLYAAAFTATSQLFILHSQVCRPYAFGLLFTCMCADACCRILFLKKRSPGAYVYLSLALAFSAYTHYFSMLTSVVLCILFFLYEEKDHRLKIGYAAAAAFLLFLPALPVFIFQLNTGGIGGWLGEPGPDFLPAFLHYLNQYNMISVLLMTGIAGVTVFHLKEAVVRRSVIIGAGIFSTVFLTGYIYSIYRNPVLQFPALLFASPFLLIALFAGTDKMRPVAAYIVLAVITAVNIYALVFTRGHYTLFYNQSYKAVSSAVSGWAEMEDAPVFLNGNNAFYFDQYTLSTNPLHCITAQTDTLSYIAFKKLLDECHSTKLILGFAKPTDLTYLGIAKEYFPYTEKSECGNSYETFLLSGKKVNDDEDILWTSRAAIPEQFDSKKEFGQNINFSTDSILKDVFVNIEASATIVIPKGSAANPQLVMSMKNRQGKTTDYRSCDVLSSGTDANGKTKLILPVRLHEITSNKNTEITAFIWNINKEVFEVSGLKVTIRKGNRFLFGTVQNIQP